jgi:hypothetical protein
MENFKEKGYKLVGTTSQGLVIYENINEDQSINVTEYKYYFNNKLIGTTEVWAELTGSLPLAMVEKMEIIK